MRDVWCVCVSAGGICCVLLIIWKGCENQTGLLMHFLDQGFLPSLESFKSPYEGLSSSYSRTQLIPLNLTGESLLLGKDQEAAAALPSPPHWAALRLVNMLIAVSMLVLLPKEIQVAE